MTEQWKDIPGYEGCYQVSDFGNVRSLTRLVKSNHGMKTVYGQMLSQKVEGKTGYKRLMLRKNGTGKTIAVHQLVMLAFVGEANGRHVNHKNQIQTDNRLENLEYVSIRENVSYSLMLKGNTIGAYDRKNGTFSSSISIDGKQYYLGTFETRELACQAYRNVRKFMGFENKYEDNAIAAQKGQSNG